MNQRNMLELAPGILRSVAKYYENQVKGINNHAADYGEEPATEENFIKQQRLEDWSLHFVEFAKNIHAFAYALERQVQGPKGPPAAGESRGIPPRG